MGVTKTREFWSARKSNILKPSKVNEVSYVKGQPVVKLEVQMER